LEIHGKFMPKPAPNEIISVSELNRQARFLLESRLNEVWLEGEISNLATPGSGHIYFSLKDRDAQVRCAMFRGANRKLRFRPENGMAVLIYAKVSIYEARGEYQLVASHMEEAGEGLLRRQFEELKNRLAAEGLFSEEHKKELPTLPDSIGVVTSPSGAAVRDILHILQRRFPGVPVTIYPTAVQGEPAAAQIAAAIEQADGRCDVLIVARGGGSLEDLWSFNEEIVARAIYNASIPVISGVGHETDFTIADLVADVRAPTPSGAAEIAVPDRGEYQRHLRQLSNRLQNSVDSTLERIAVIHRQTDHRLNRCSPEALLLQRSQRLDELSRRLQSGLKDNAGRATLRLNALLTKLRDQSPAIRVQNYRQRLTVAAISLNTTAKGRLDKGQQRLALAAARLNTVSPLATLERGYAIVADESDAIINDVSKLKPGQNVTTRLSNGSYSGTVTSIKKN